MAASQSGPAERADATRNKDAILDATLRCLNESPRATVGDIATAAGVGRGTVHAHFPTREDLIHAVFERTIRRTETEMAALDLTRAPWVCIEELIQTSWRVFDQFNGFLEAAEHEVEAARVRAFHGRPLSLLQPLLVRGRSEGAFRTDHTVELQTACLYAILHVAGAEIREGRFTERDATHALRGTIRSLLFPIRESPIAKEPR